MAVRHDVIECAPVLSSRLRSCSHARGTQARHHPLRRCERVHHARRAPRSGGRTRADEPILRACPAPHPRARRHAGEVHRRRGDGGVRATACPRQRCRAGAGRGARPARRGGRRYGVGRALAVARRGEYGRSGGHQRAGAWRFPGDRRCGQRGGTAPTGGKPWRDRRERAHGGGRGVCVPLWRGAPGGSQREGSPSAGVPARWSPAGAPDEAPAVHRPTPGPRAAESAVGASARRAAAAAGLDCGAGWHR